MKYEVALEKDEFGLGIYFTSIYRNDVVTSGAMVDLQVPFYRLPNGEKAPAEASGKVHAGDKIVAINRKDVRSLSFDDIIECLRHLPTGETLLEFEQLEDNNPRIMSGNDETGAQLEDGDPESVDNLRARIKELELALERETLCRKMIMKKMSTYKKEIIKLSEDKMRMKVDIEKRNNEKQILDKFLFNTMLSI